MVITKDDSRIKVHYMDRGTVEDGHVEFFDEPGFRERFTFVEDVRIKLSNLAPGWRAFTTLPTNHPIHSLVGQVAAKWSEVEHVLDHAIWRLAKIDDNTGACLTAQILGSGNRITAILALCHHRKIDPTLIKKLRSLSGKILVSQNLRNRILHDAWYIEEPNEEPRQFKSMAKGEFLFGFHPVDEAFLNKVLAEMQKRLDEINKFLTAICAATK
jgi:hypothetical protein